jgi:Tol biopolymer transport system component
MAKEVMLMNRIGPSKSALYVADADGTGEHKLLAASGFHYYASYSYDGKWIVFTSERGGLGQADIYRVHPDGTGPERKTRVSYQAKSGSKDGLDGARHVDTLPAEAVP